MQYTFFFINLWSVKVNVISNFLKFIKSTVLFNHRLSLDLREWNFWKKRNEGMFIVRRVVKKSRNRGTSKRKKKEMIKNSKESVSNSITIMRSGSISGCTILRRFLPGKVVGRERKLRAPARWRGFGLSYSISLFSRGRQSKPLERGKWHRDRILPFWESFTRI